MIEYSAHEVPFPLARGSGNSIDHMLRDASARGLAVLDLFAGCGAFSLGFSRAGFEIVGGIEIDPDAERTHSMNFPPKVQPNRPCDIQKVAADEVTQPLSSLYAGERIKIDVIIGGPPCQPFTRVGRAKLREVAGRVHAHIEDKRVPLFTHFLRFVAELRPLAFVMENVHHLASFAGRNIAEEVAVSAEDLGYDVRYAILNSVWYGIPQMRERLFIIGIEARLGLSPAFPKRSHAMDLPVGYTTSRSGRPNYVPVLGPSPHYVGEMPAEKVSQPAITVEEALGDLPVLAAHLSDPRARKSARKFDGSFCYRPVEPSPYAARMRQWPGFESNGVIADHVIRYPPRDYETFRRKLGSTKPDALPPPAFVEFSRQRGYDLVGALVSPN